MVTHGKVMVEFTIYDGEIAGFTQINAPQYSFRKKVKRESEKII